MLAFWSRHFRHECRAVSEGRYRLTLQQKSAPHLPSILIAKPSRASSSISTVDNQLGRYEGLTNLTPSRCSFVSEIWRSPLFDGLFGPAGSCTRWTDNTNRGASGVERLLTVTASHIIRHCKHTEVWREEVHLTVLLFLGAETVFWEWYQCELCHKDRSWIVWKTPRKTLFGTNETAETKRYRSLFCHSVLTTFKDLGSSTEERIVTSRISVSVIVDNG